MLRLQPPSTLFVFETLVVFSCFTVQTPQLQILPVQIAAPAGLNEIKPFCFHVITPPPNLEMAVEVNL